MYSIPINQYGDLCTELYERLHPVAEAEELDFYLSYASPKHRILEPLCGSGRFLIPFLRRGLSICGMDSSRPMLDRLRSKAPEAHVIEADLTSFAPDERFDYIFIPSGSLGLFTDLALLCKILKNLRSMLTSKGILVFSVDTTATQQTSSKQVVTASARLENGLELVLKTRYTYNADTQTQYAPGLYELYDGEQCIQQEYMDFQTHLYRPGEMEQLLRKAGFEEISVYSSFQKDTERYNDTPFLLYECR